DPVLGPRTDGRQPLPLPRLLDARLEPARDPEPDLGRPAARPEVVGRAARAGFPRGTGDRGGALARPRRRRPALRPAQGVRRRARRRARSGPSGTMIEAVAPARSAGLPETPYVGLVPDDEDDVRGLRQ